MRDKAVAVLICLMLACAVAFSQDVSGLGRAGVKVLPLSSQTDGTTNLLEGNVVLVYDGDTFSLVAKDGSMYVVRIEGIDAPENRQTFGSESSKNLAALIQGMDVVVLLRSVDARDRRIGSVFVDGEDVGLMQLRRGMAWNDPVLGSAQSPDQREIYGRAEAKARTDRAGLWSKETPIAPWEFRGERPTQMPPEKVATGSETSATDVQKPSPSTTTVADPASRKYIIGPRGGCYYLNDGVKVYVRDKTRCVKQ
jgi:endonuclease YncB( thermonuclease family)